MNRIIPKLLTLLLLINCNNGKSNNRQAETKPATTNKELSQITQYDSSINTIHVLVALCDNKYQGIVPVPAKIGNGQDPDNNLYWGCGYGIRSYFSNTKNWQLVKRIKINDTLMERVIFKHKQSNYYLVADAYNGKYIKQCTIDFLQSCAGQIKDTMQVQNKRLGIKGNARLLTYIGHDGLMDFRLNENFNNTDNKNRDAIMLACISKKYFAPHLQATKANPLLWSTGLMSPEAYTLHDAVESYITKESAATIRTKAAMAYAKFQKCSVKAAGNLLVSGW